MGLGKGWTVLIHAAAGGVGSLGVQLAVALGARVIGTASVLTASPGARAHYDRRKEAGDRHVAAQRNLFNRFMGMLFHCLQHREPYDELKAFPNQSAADLAAAAA